MKVLEIYIHIMESDPDGTEANITYQTLEAHKAFKSAAFQLQDLYSVKS